MSYIPKEAETADQYIEKGRSSYRKKVSCDGRDFRWGRAGNHDGAGWNPYFFQRFLRRD